MVELKVRSVFRERGHLTYYTCHTLERVDNGKKIFIEILQNDLDKTFAVDWFSTFMYSKSLRVTRIKTLEEAIKKAQELYNKFRIEPLYRMQFKIDSQFYHVFTITPDEDKIGYRNVSLQRVENEKYL